MTYLANQVQINHLVEILAQSFEVYAPTKVRNKANYSRITKAESILWQYDRTIMPFKKILFPDHTELTREHQKIAIMGMPLCDIAALSILQKQFSGSGLMPERDDLIIIGGDCSPDENCFCNQYDLASIYDYDLFIIKNGKDYRIKVNSWRGKNLAAKIGLKKSSPELEIKPKAKAEKFDLELTAKNISNKNFTHDFWQGIANNCFGCGACTTVCPLCFCFRQDFQSCPDGSDKKCLKWDSCFANEFSQIQYGLDMRPTNTDRFYNWYHHKFVRGPRELGHPLCVGCGRCITACPAHLSIRNIVESLNNKYPK